MGFLIIDKMIDRINIAKQDSDVAYFNDLLLFGELVEKIIVLGLISAVKEEREHYKYSQEYRLVRADGIGEWGQVIEEIMTGLTSQFLIDSARDDQKDLTMKCGIGSWQYESIKKLHDCLVVVTPNSEDISTKVKGIKWFQLFANLRNATRGHGAQLSEQCSKMCLPLYDSILLLVNNLNIFKHSWAYLHRSLSGKYKITSYSEGTSDFDYLKTSEAITGQHKYDDGVYIYYDKPYKINLLFTDADAVDFFFPNGNFTNKSFEVISYITNNKQNKQNDGYLTPATSLPNSETQGNNNLDVQGNSFGNIPQKQTGYIKRKQLEEELYKVLIDDRHPIITLFGRGGIGKTWLTLEILHKIAEDGRFDYILWFSSRDIDLLSNGAKPVKAHVQTIKEISDEYINLVCPEKNSTGVNSEEILSKVMINGDNDKYLFVFDNFETVQSPAELYNWIDTFIRPPNKVLITSRIRDFKGDFPIEVNGMNEVESKELINKTAIELSIQHLITNDYINSLVDESYGHPYVMKVLLGEIAKEGKIVKIERIIASIDNILEALFERTFNGLTPVAKRVFLTLCAWRSPVSQLALEAVLLRPVNETMDVAAAIKELRYSSFIEERNAENENEEFLFVPLVASEFGKKKLLTYPYNSSINSDIQILQYFGAIQQTAIEKGVQPRIEQLINNIRKRVNGKEQLVNDYTKMLEFLASKYIPAWLLLADLYHNYKMLPEAIEALNRYIESGLGNEVEIRQTWYKLAQAYEETGDYKNEIYVLIELSAIPKTPFYEISEAANKVNGLLKNIALDQEEKRIILEKLAIVMESRISEGDADDCSRLGWLYMGLRKEEKAREIANRGLNIEPDNKYCQNIMDRLNSDFEIFKRY